MRISPRATNGSSDIIVMLNLTSSRHNNVKVSMIVTLTVSLSPYCKNDVMGKTCVDKECPTGRSGQANGDEKSPIMYNIALVKE